MLTFINGESVQVYVEKALNKNHRYLGLKMNEVSIVTEPGALADQEEADKGVGFPVVKLGTEAPVPESIKKAISLKEGEDYATVIATLANACRLTLQVQFSDVEEIYWFSPVRVLNDYVLMADWFYQEDVIKEECFAFKCYYTQNADGSFTITKVIKVQLKFVEESTGDATKVHVTITPPAGVVEPATPAPGATAMKVLKSLNLGGVVMALTAAPGFELKGSDGALIVKVNDKGEPEVGAGYALDDAGVVTKLATPVAPAEPVVQAAAKGVGFGPADLIAMAAKSGATFKFMMTPDGSFSAETLPVGTATPTVTSPAAVISDATKVFDDQVANHPVVKRLEAELASVKQAAAGTSGTDPQAAGAAPTYQGGAPQPAAVKKSLLPTDSPGFGLFTMGFQGRRPPGAPVPQART